MGTEQSVGKLDRTALLDYLGELQAPERLIVTAAGRVRHEEIVAQVERLTSHLAPAGPGPEQPAPRFRAQQSRLAQPGAQVHFCLVFPGISRTDEARHAFAVLDTILGGGNSSRLFQEIRENRGLTYGIGSYEQNYRETGLFVITAGTAPGNFELVLELIEKETARLCSEPPSEEELERAKVQLRVALAMAAESTSFRMQHLALSESFWGRVLSFQEIAEGVERVTAEDVHRLAQAVFQGGEKALVAIGPVEDRGRAK